MASSSNPWNQQIQRARVPMLEHSSTMNYRIFCQYFQRPIDYAVNIVVIYDDNNSQCGFGVVLNEESLHTGGHFNTVPYWAGWLRVKIGRISNTLRDRHFAPQDRNIILKSINYAQLQSPLISSLLQQSHIISFFKNPRPSYDFKVVALFPDVPCGFGFIQVPPVASTDASERNYLISLRALVHQMMEIIDGGITEICGRSFTPPAAVRPFFNLPSVQPSGSYSNSVHGARQQQQLPGRDATGTNYAQSDSNLVMQHQQPESFILSQPTAAVFSYDTPSGAYVLIDQNTNQSAGMQQQQSFILYEPTDIAVFPYQANLPFGAYVYSDQATSTSILPGSEQNTGQWSGNRNAAGMQQQQSFILYEPTAAVFPYQANLPSGANVWSGQATSTNILLGSEQDTIQSSGSRYAAAMQQPHTPSGAHLWSGQGTSTGTLSGGEQNPNQPSSDRNEVVMQQQQSPDSISRATEASRLGPNENA